MDEIFATYALERLDGLELSDAVWPWQADARQRGVRHRGPWLPHTALGANEKRQSGIHLEPASAGTHGSLSSSGVALKGAPMRVASATAHASASVAIAGGTYACQPNRFAARFPHRGGDWRARQSSPEEPADGQPSTIGDPSVTGRSSQRRQQKRSQYDEPERRPDWQGDTKHIRHVSAKAVGSEHPRHPVGDGPMVDGYGQRIEPASLTGVPNQPHMLRRGSQPKQPAQHAKSGSPTADARPLANPCRRRCQRECQDGKVTHALQDAKRAGRIP